MVKLSGLIFSNILLLRLTRDIHINSIERQRQQQQKTPLPSFPATRSPQPTPTPARQKVSTSSQYSSPDPAEFLLTSFKVSRLHNMPAVQTPTYKYSESITLVVEAVYDHYAITQIISIDSCRKNYPFFKPKFNLNFRSRVNCLVILRQCICHLPRVIQSDKSANK